MLVRTHEWMIARRYLQPQKDEPFISLIAVLSIIGIGLGVAVLIVVMSVMNGFQATMINQIIGLNGHIVVQSGPDGVRDYEGIVEDIRRLDHVVQVRPSVYGQVMATAYDYSRGAQVRGINPEDYADHPLLGEQLIIGEPVRRDNSCMLGIVISRSFKCPRNSPRPILMTCLAQAAR